MLSLTTDDYNVMPFLVERGALKVNKPGTDFFFKKTQLPYIGEMNVSKFVTDADLKKLEYAMIKDTYAHRFECFYKDNIAPSSTNRMVSFIVGEGLTVTVEGDEEAEKIIKNWNDEINVRHETIEDFFKDVIHDNQINKQSLWRIYVDKSDPVHKVDLQRVSMRNIKTEIHPTRGWRRWIQNATVPAKSFTKVGWYKSKTVDIFQSKLVQTILWDEPQACVFVSLFKKPPVSTVLHFLVYKRWIAWFMRKFAEKHWAPFLIGYVGDPKNGYMPPNPQDEKDSLNHVTDALRKVRNYGSIALLATTKVDVLDTKVSQNANVYVEYMKHINEEIAHGLYTSMGFLESGSREYGKNLIFQDSVRFIRGIREKIAVKLRKFYASVLLPAYGKEGFESSDIKINFPMITTGDVKELTDSVDKMARIGAFKDMKEIRKILNSVWKHISEEITDEEEKEMSNKFMELAAPSRAEQDVPQSRVGGSSVSKKTEKPK